jgi:hypothetical protein
MASKKTDERADKKRRSADKSNLISAVFVDSKVKEVEDLLTKAEGLMPFLIALSAEERAETLRVGDKLVVGAVEIIALVREYGDYIPKAVADPDEMERDAALDAALARVEARLERLLGLVRDARLLARSDLARKALSAYAAARLIPDYLGAGAKTEKLKEFFTSRSRSK